MTPLLVEKEIQVDHGIKSQNNYLNHHLKSISLKKQSACCCCRIVSESKNHNEVDLMFLSVSQKLDKN